MIGNILFLCVLFVHNCNFIDGLAIVPRSEWGATAAKGDYKTINGAVDYVVIHHMATTSCNSKIDCVNLVKKKQKKDMGEKIRDIKYNFLVSEEGNVYEGQGWGKAGSHAGNLNHKSVGICIIGTYTNSVPNEKALNAVKELIANGVSNGKISQNYKLIGHKQVKVTECPGTAMYNLLQTWPNYSAIVV